MLCVPAEAQHVQRLPRSCCAAASGSSGNSFSFCVRHDVTGVPGRGALRLDLLRGAGRAAAGHPKSLNPKTLDALLLAKYVTPP